MGLSMSTNNAIFLTTFDGFFERKLKAAAPGSVQRTNKNNVVIDVMQYNTLAGRLVKLEYKETKEYGNFWTLTLEEDHTYKLDLSADSSSTYYLLNRLLNPNVNYDLPIELKIFAEIENDKKKTVILLKQAGVIINGVYSKDNQQDQPQMVEVKFKGKMVWDSTERDEFIKLKLEQNVIPKLSGGTTTGAHATTPLPTEEDMPEWAKEEAKK